jgi:septal ring factor EnvC (AmiA/AmiB activator)
MSDNTMPERITQRDERHRPVEYIRADVHCAHLAAANARIARAEDTATHAVEAWRKATAAHDVIIGQWKTEERMWRDADKKQLTEIAALRDEVVEARRHDARQLNEIELMQAKIAELEAAQR